MLWRRSLCRAAVTHGSSLDGNVHKQTMEKLERIIIEHLIGGKVVEELVNDEPFQAIGT